MTGSPTIHRRKKATKRPAPRKEPKPVTASLLPSYAEMVRKHLKLNSCLYY